MRKIELTTKRLHLVPNGPQYIDEVHEYAGNPENCKYMAYFPSADREETLQFLKHCEEEWDKAAPAVYEFAILLDGKMIGGIGADIYEDIRESELGWVIHRDYWGQGIVTEAAKRILVFVKEERGITHFFAHCDSENIGSSKVMEKLGMRLAGQTPGRRNRLSDEERIDSKYELIFE